jgi:hypothetical protein
MAAPSLAGGGAGTEPDMAGTRLLLYGPDCFYKNPIALIFCGRDLIAFYLCTQGLLCKF